MYFNSSHLIKEESKSHHHTFLKVVRDNADLCNKLSKTIIVIQIIISSHRK